MGMEIVIDEINQACRTPRPPGKGTRIMDEPVMSDGVTVFGANWCKDTKRSRALLDQLGVEYTFVDVDQSAKMSSWVAAQNGGQRRIPAIVVAPDQPVLIEPSDPELLAALQEAGLSSASV